MVRLGALPQSEPTPTMARAGGLAPSTARPGRFSALRDTAVVAAGGLGGLITGFSLGFLLWHLV